MSFIKLIVYQNQYFHLFYTTSDYYQVRNHVSYVKLKIICMFIENTALR